MSTTPSERTQQRRRLLKAAAAAPAIFTLNAEARDLAFSTTQCVVRGQALHTPPAPPTVTDFPDAWVRERITVGGVEKFQIADVGHGPVYGGTCWNSFYQGQGRQADGNNVLIP